jgi:hypothetical protein
MALRLSLLVALAALAVTANALYTANVFIVNLSGEEMIFGGCATSVNNTLPVAPQSIPVGQVRQENRQRNPGRSCKGRGKRGCEGIGYWKGFRCEPCGEMFDPTLLDINLFLRLKDGRYFTSYAPLGIRFRSCFLSVFLVHE